jgi:hypothetical protein
MCALYAGWLSYAGDPSSSPPLEALQALPVFEELPSLLVSQPWPVDPRSWGANETGARLLHKLKQQTLGCLFADHAGGDPGPSQPPALPPSLDSFVRAPPPPKKKQKRRLLAAPQHFQQLMPLPSDPADDDPRPLPPPSPPRTPPRTPPEPAEEPPVGAVQLALKDAVASRAATATGGESGEAADAPDSDEDEEEAAREAQARARREDQAAPSNALAMVAAEPSVDLRTEKMPPLGPWRARCCGARGAWRVARGVWRVARGAWRVARACACVSRCVCV